MAQPVIAGAVVPVLHPHPGSEQTVAIEATHNVSTAVSLECRCVRLYGSVDHHIQIDGAPVATTGMTPGTAQVDYSYGILPGQKVSVIKAAGESDGTLWITEMR